MLDVMPHRLRHIFRALLNYGLLVLGIFVGVAIIVTVDVNITLAAMANDPSIQPNMAPEIRFAFIPVLAAFVAVPTVVIHAIAGVFHKRHFHPAVWFSLGLAFSTVLLFMPLRYVPGNPLLKIALSAIAAVLAVISIRMTLGKKEHAV